MSTTRKSPSTHGNTIALTAAIFACATAIVTLAVIDPSADTAMSDVSFDVAPPTVAPPAVATAPAEPPKPTLVSANGVPAGAARPADDRWSADESSGGTRPDAMH